jgi:hypothetical protein
VRIARLLHEDTEEASPFVLLALERDGALYDVAELERAFDTPYSPERFALAGDFHTRVIALACAGLFELDERLKTGERPSAARVLPGTFSWLPPCDTERALLVELRPVDAGGGFRLGNARNLGGHAVATPFPEGETRPVYALGLAAVLREDLVRASADEAERAVLGYTILNGWFGRDDEARDPAASRRTAAQLGPALVTVTEVGELGGLRAQARLDGRVVEDAVLGGSPAARLAELSRWVDLRGGDVVALPLRAGDAPWGAPVEVLIERLGKLGGRAVR